MATFRFELDHKATRNKTYNLYLMITAAGKRAKKKTGVELKRIDDFNPKCRGNNWIRANVPDAKSLNEHLRQLLVEANNQYRSLGDEKFVTSANVIKAMNTERVSPSFLEFAKERTQMIYDAGGLRNWKKYNGFLNKLEVFRKKRRMADVTMDDLTVDFMKRFDNFLHKWKNEREPEKLLHPNTIEVQFNIMRALVNQAIESGLMEATKNPFIGFKYKGVATVKEKLNQIEIEKIENLELEEGSLIWHCRNYFMFSYYCAGIRAGDLIQLRWRDVSKTGRLHYQMGKNHKDRDLVLVEQAIRILNHYHSDDVKPEDYIFPLLNNNDPFAKYITQADKDRMTPELRQQLYQQISAKNALINKYLKKIAEKAELTSNLTMHISRHSFAHIALESGAESSAIKNILGHSKLSTTERYMGNFDTAKSDETLKSLFGKKYSTLEDPNTGKEISSSAEGRQADEKTISRTSEEAPISKQELALSLLKEMTPEQIMALLGSINK